jgi:putative NADH-flavin reductase
MNLLIFGATGTVGRPLVFEALAQGHQVTAFVRDPASFTKTHDRLRVVRGDALLASDVNRVVQGHDAVLCCIGAGAKGHVRSAATRNIVRAMDACGVKRFICQSTLGVGESWNNLTFFWKRCMFGLLLRQAYADHVKQEEIVTQSRLEWTIVRPSAFTDGPYTGAYRHGFSSLKQKLALNISRADLVEFLLRQLGDDTYLHKQVGISN